MPKFSKSALSQFLRTGCRRQLKLHMSKGRAEEISAAYMPPSQPARPGFSDVAEAGQEWEVRKLTELREHFGPALRGSGSVFYRDDGPRFEFANRDLGDPDMLLSAQAGEFLVKLAAWEGELELTVFDVFRFRIDQIIRQVVPSVLATPWQDLAFHVTTSCKNCDCLGYPWRKADGTGTWHPDHCWPTGERNGGHLSRIPGISRGAAEVLSHYGHGTVQDVAVLPQTADAYNRHQSLRVGRTVIGARAMALDHGGAGVAPDSGTSASMPHFVNLQLFITASFDVSSALTLSLGVSGSIYAKPFRPGPTLGPKRYKTEVRVSDLRDPDREFHTLRRFLADIRAILNDADIKDWKTPTGVRGKATNKPPTSAGCRSTFGIN